MPYAGQAQKYGLGQPPRRWCAGSVICLPSTVALIVLP
jgi:hypothetical protein